MSETRHDPRQAKASAAAPTDLNPRTEPALDFPDREFGTLSPQDYHELGFLCGLEVHQQLLTRSKLFCRCPAGRRVTRADAEVLRHMRPTLSELGEYDGCALMEFKTRKEIVYLLERSTVCTYEIDDTPPFPIDEEAVRIALEVCRRFDMQLASELQVMRKQYLDGSIPTGFQRTAMVGIGGTIPFRDSELGSGRELRIRQLTLEEDSCREVSDVGHRVTFRTDRLGTPLIETVTEPDLFTPRDVAAGGRLLADVVRVTGKVRRGAGAARQDVNVSVAGSRRVEIKGVCNHRGLPRLVHNEAFRQLNLLRIRAALRRLGVQPAWLELPPVGLPWHCSDLVIDATSVLRRCDYAPVRRARERGDTICAVRLPGFGAVLGHRTQPGIAFAHELAERVRVIACLTTQPFMIASNVEGYGLSPTTWRQLRSACKADADDGVVVLWGPERDVSTAAREVLARSREALDGVPSETRQAHADGTNGFERILPGPERMYPDTDTPPLPIPDAWVEAIGPAERPWEREDRLRDAGLTEAVARRLAVAPWADLFDQLLPMPPDLARRIAAALEKRLPHYWREVKERSMPEPERLRPLVFAVAEGRLDVSAVEPVLDRLLRETAPAADILAEHRPVDTALDGLIEAAAAHRQQLHVPDGDPALRWAMGRVLNERPRGQLDPAIVRERLAIALGQQETGGQR